MLRKLSATTIALALTVAAAALGMIGMAYQIDALNDQVQVLESEKRSLMEGVDDLNLTLRGQWEVNAAYAQMLTPAQHDVVMESLADGPGCSIDCGIED